MKELKVNNCPICGQDEFIFSDYLKAPGQGDWTYDCFKNKRLSTCKRCKFTFTSEFFEKGSLSKFYNTLYSRSKLSPFKAYENYEFTMRSLSHVNFIKTNLDLKDDLNILEIGPNENGMIPSFSLYCKPNYFYYDQEDFPVLNHYGGIRLGKYFSMEAASSIKTERKMDLIVLSHSFEHLEPQYLNQDVQAMKLALKPYGCVSIEVPIESLFHPPHTQSFNTKNMSLLFEKHGFEIIATQYIESLNDDNKNEFLNNQLELSSSKIKFIKKVMSILIPRRIRLRLLKPLYERKLKALYEGLPYMRLIAQLK